jgi:hypothetical protein
MRGNKQIIKSVFIFLLLAGSTLAFGQRKNTASAAMIASPGNSASGTLTVTCIVATSVGVVTGEDGQQRIVIANAPDPADNVSQFVMLTDQPRSATSTDPKKNKKHLR